MMLVVVPHMKFLPTACMFFLSCHLLMSCLTPSSKGLDVSLQEAHAFASANASALPSVPPELIQYVEGGRNPDIYTREFVELVHRGNQLMRGKMHAFAHFRDILADHISEAMPELRTDVEEIVRDTGGRAPAPIVPAEGNESNGAQTQGVENGD